MKPLLLAVLLAPLSCALGQETQEERRLPEELAITRSIVLQDTDELESSAHFRLFKFHGQKQITPAAEFEYGVTDRWEIDAEVPYEFINPSKGPSVNGVGDVETRVRYGVLPVGKQPWALDVGLTLGIPTGDRLHNLGEGRLTLTPFFTASTWLGPFNAQLNGGWQRAVTDAGGEPRDDFAYNVAVLYPIDHWFLALEGNGDSNHRRTMYYVTPELIWKPGKSLSFLIAAPIGVTRAAGDYGIVASVTLELENVTHRGSGNKD